MTKNQQTRSLAARARYLYIGIPAVAMVLFLIIGSMISRSMADDFAKRLARQYSIEAASNFQISTNQHFVLMQQTSRSTTIARWMANRDDAQLKRLAYEEIRGYHIFSPETRLMFTLADGLWGYDHFVSMDFEDFQTWGQLAYAANPNEDTRRVSQWFFDTRDEERPFIMNVQRERPALIDEDIVLFIWSNHRVYYGADFVGVVTVGFPFAEVFDAVFGNYDDRFIRGYLVDGYGRVRTDSAGLLTLHEEGLPTPKPLPEAEVNPNLADALEQHLGQLQNGVFQTNGDFYEVIRLGEGDYRYASIAPILGSAWSVVVLSNYNAVFGGRYIPMFVVAFLILVSSIGLGVLMVRHELLAPLFKLTESAATPNQRIFGVDRHDELGELARTISDMRASLEATARLAEDSNRLKSDFLSTISHEIRTPMNSIIGMSAIGKEAKEIVRKNYAFDQINVSSSYLLGIINDVLDMSKIEVGHLELSHETFELEAALQKVATVSHFLLEEKEQRLRMEMDPSIPNRVMGDEQRLVQILINLTSNAVKFSPNGTEIKILVALHCDAEENCFLEFKVADQGIGISAAQQENIFNAFEQGSRSTARQYGGTGLGLSISKKLVEMMGGRIWVESEPGAGATFSFTIMVAAAEFSPLEEPALEAESEKEADFTGKRLLLVDDVDINREIVMTMLEHTGLTIECAENGAVALEMFEADPWRYDLIFMDVHMPVMDGYATTEKIRSLGMPWAQAIPIVAITANAFQEDIDKCLEAGMNRHLSKPLRHSDMIALLQDYWQ